MTIPDFLVWIEEHPTTIEIIKWTILLVIAWITGVFSFFKKFIKKTQLEIIDTASLCFVEEIDELEGHSNLARVGYFINLSIKNPSTEKVVIETFGLSYLPQKRFKSYSENLILTTLSDRPRQKMGSGTKYSKVFFTKFNDGMGDLTMNGVLNPRDFQNGYVFFVNLSWGNWNPKIVNEKIKIRISAKLTTGEVSKDSSWIRVTKDKECMEKFVPGIIDQIKYLTT